MYRLTALTSDGTVFCGEHHSLTECSEVAGYMYKFMNESMGIMHTTFIAEKGNECVHAWIY